MRLAIVLVLMAITGSAQAESWRCTYPGFGPNRAAVRDTFELKNGTLVDKAWEMPYQVIVSNQFAVIAVDAEAKVDGAHRYISAATIIIDREGGGFIYSIGEIGSEPRSTVGRCISP